MIQFIRILAVGTFSLFLVAVATAATEKNKSAASAAAAAPKTTSTEHNFEDMLVQGKFHFSDEAVTTVEDDKVLDSLIGVRSDFKDRLKMSQSQF